jgi:hypothetical protein
LGFRSLTGIVAVEKFKSRVSFSLTIALGRARRERAARFAQRDIFGLLEVKTDLAE